MFFSKVTIGLFSKLYVSRPSFVNSEMNTVYLFKVKMGPSMGFYAIHYHFSVHAQGKSR